MDKLRKIALWVLIVLGLLISADLIYIFIKSNFIANAPASFCSVNSLIDCDGVAKTEYSVFLGVPLALWGFILYLLFAFLMLVDKLDKKFPNTIFKLFKNPKSYIASFALLSFCISISLAMISIFKINKICVMCFATYFIDLFIALFAKSKGFFIEDIKNTIKDFMQGVREYTTLFAVVVIVFCGTLSYLTYSNILAPNLKEGPYAKYQKLDKNPWGIEGNTLGNENAPIKVMVYGDFMCPFCRISNMFVHKLAKDNNNVSIKHMNFPLDTTCNPYVHQDIHPGACFLARYALAAERQGNYWGVVNMIYNDHPKDLNELLAKAKEMGLNPDKLTSDANSNDVFEELSMQINYAQSKGVNATPSFIITDILYTGIMPYEELLEKSKQAYRRYQRDNKNE